MSVSPITSVSALTENNPKPTNPTAGLGRDAFMQLLLAQLRNQDPLKPMEDRDFIAQLAQFNVLEQMQALNEAVQTLVLTQGLTEGSSLIGKRIKATGQEGATVEGVVSAASVSQGRVLLHIGDKSVPLIQVVEVTA